MDRDDLLRRVMVVARALQRVDRLTPGDWPDLGVALILEGIDDPEVVELAALGPNPSGWVTDEIAARLYDRLGVTEPDIDGAVSTLVGTLVAEVEARPPAGSNALMRLVGSLAPPRPVRRRMLERRGQRAPGGRPGRAEVAEQQLLQRQTPSSVIEAADLRVLHGRVLRSGTRAHPSRVRMDGWTASS